VKSVEDVALEQLLVADTDLDGVVTRAALLVPGLDNRHVKNTASAAGALVEGLRRPVECDTISSILGIDFGNAVVEQRLEALGQSKLVLVQQRLDIFGQCKVVFLLGLFLLLFLLTALNRHDGVNERIEEKGGQVRVVGLDVAHGWVMVIGQIDFSGSVVVEVRERNFVFSSYLVTNDNLVDVIELIPVFVVVFQITEQRFEFRTTRNSAVECLGGEERLLFKHVEVVLIDQIAHQLIGQTVQVGENRGVQSPFLVAGTIDVGSSNEWLRIIEPLEDGCVFFLVQIDADRIERLDVQNVVTKVKWRLFVVKRREAHSLEVLSISLLSSHHHPHGTPLSCVHGLDNARDFVYKGDRTGKVVKDLNVTHIFPRPKKYNIR
jgi:hypothetical protein